MDDPQAAAMDERFERALGRLLRAGVLLSALVVLAGGGLYLARHGGEAADRRTFHGEPAELRRPAGIVRATLDGQAQGIVALGLLLLVATPIARVLFSAAAFARQRDYTYVAVTAFVFAILLYSLAGPESSPSRTRTYNKPVTPTPWFPRGVDYLITRVGEGRR